VAVERFLAWRQSLELQPKLGQELTGSIPRVKSVGYLYLSVLSVFFKMFCRAPFCNTPAPSEGA
jgi:hypothetical protein